MFGISFIKIETKFSCFYHMVMGRLSSSRLFLGYFFWLKLAYLNTFFAPDNRIHTQNYICHTRESFIQSTRYTHTISYPYYNFLQLNLFDIVNILHLILTFIYFYWFGFSYANTNNHQISFAKLAFFTNQQLLFFLFRILFLFNDFDWEFSSF